MLIGQILRIWECSGVRHALAVAISAAVAFLLTVGTTPLSQVPMAAGIAQIGLMQEEHSLMADYLNTRANEDKVAVVAEAREREDMRAISASATIATTIPLPKPAKLVRRAAAAKIEVATADPSPPPAAPVPLPPQSASSSPSPITVPKGARGVLATVERVPRLAWTAVQNAADWAIIGPVQTIVRLPERRFL